MKLTYLSRFSILIVRNNYNFQSRILTIFRFNLKISFEKYLFYFFYFIRKKKNKTKNKKIIKTIFFFYILKKKNRKYFKNLKKNKKMHIQIIEKSQIVNKKRLAE